MEIKIYSPEEIKLSGEKHRKERPIHFFFHRILPRKYRIIKRYFNDFYWEIRWRTTNRYNVVKIPTLKPGYYDKDRILLHASFALLVDFVEHEKACMQSWLCNEKKTKQNAVELGLKYLDWEIGLKYGPDDFTPEDDPNYGQPTPQSKNSLEIKALYLWWKSYLIREKEFYENYDYTFEEELNFYHEADEMLARLAKVRGSLWT